MRKAKDEDIKKIKKGDFFLVYNTHNGKVLEYEAAHDARYNGRHWYVMVKAYTLDARTGVLVQNAAKAFNNRDIVIDDNL